MRHLFYNTMYGYLHTQHTHTTLSLSLLSFFAINACIRWIKNYIYIRSKSKDKRNGVIINSWRSDGLKRERVAFVCHIFTKFTKDAFSFPHHSNLKRKCFLMIFFKWYLYGHGLKMVLDDRIYKIIISSIDWFIHTYSCIN